MSLVNLPLLSDLRETDLIFIIKNHQYNFDDGFEMEGMQSLKKLCELN